MMMSSYREADLLFLILQRLCAYNVIVKRCIIFTVLNKYNKIINQLPHLKFFIMLTEELLKR